MKKVVWGAVHLAFDQSGVNFCHPTKEGLRKVVGLLASKALSWETPSEVVAHNMAQILKFLESLPND